MRLRRTRHIDRRVAAVRYCDGLQDIASKIKEKAKALAAEFKGMKKGQKIAWIIANIARIAGLVLTAKSAVEMKQQIGELNKQKANLENQAKILGNSTGLLATAVKEGIAENPAKKRAVALKLGLKGFLGLATAFAATSAEKVIRAGLPSDYNEENYPEG